MAGILRLHKRPVPNLLFAWGDNTYGQLGNDTVTLKSSPIQVGAATNWSVLAAGAGTFLGIRSGKLYAWGRNDQGQLGDGTRTNCSSPIQIGAETDWTAVATGGSVRRSAGIRGGKLFSWGANTTSQLGDGTTTPQSSPIQIGSDTNWTAIAVGFYATHGIRGGALFGWGRGDHGQIGDGGTAVRSVPVAIGAETDWTAIMGGREYACGIRGGKLFSWGLNSYGECGYASIENASPIQVGAETDWTALGVNNAFSNTTFGFRGGKLFGFGLNGTYQLVDGSLTNRSSPIQIGAETDWTACATGTGSAYGIHGGKLFSWADNTTYGQLGLGDRATRSSPVQVGGAADWVSIVAGEYGAGGVKGS